MANERMGAVGVYAALTAKAGLDIASRTIDIGAILVRDALRASTGRDNAHGIGGMRFNAVGVRQARLCTAP
jgi:hypothetical protein